MTTTRPPEELDTQVPENQWAVEFRLFASLLHFGSGWFANHALQGTRHGVVVCSHCVPFAGSLSFGR